MAEAFGRRPAAVLLWALALAAVAQALVGMMQLQLYNPYSQPERTAALEAWGEQGEGRTDILFLGDSRASLAFMPPVIDDEAARAGRSIRSFSLCAPLSTILSDAAVLDYALSRGARPRVIIWGMGQRQTGLGDLARFQRNEATLGFACALSRAVPSWRNLCTVGFACVAPARILLQLPVALLPQYREELTDMRRLRGWTWAYGTDGWSRRHNADFVPNAPRTIAEWQEAVLKQQAQRPLAEFAQDRTVDAALSRALARARSCGATVVFVNMPTVRACRSYEHAHGYPRYLAWLQQACRLRGARVVDLCAPPLLPPDSDFADTYHLSAAGAERLSRRFVRDTIVPVLDGAAR